MKIRGIINAMGINGYISIVKDSIVPKNLFYIFFIIFVKCIFVNKYFFKKNYAMRAIFNTLN